MDVGRDLVEVDRVLHQVDQPQVDHAVQLGQRGRLEGLDQDVVGALREPVAVEHLHQRFLEGEPEPGEVRRRLGLGVDTDRPAQAAFLGGRQVQDLLERGHGEPAVEDRVLRAYPGNPLDRAKRT